VKRKALPNKKAPAPVEIKAAQIKRPFTFRVTVHEYPTHLRVGDIFEFAGRDHVVIKVNASCARIVPVTEGQPKQVTLKPRFSDKPVTFSVPERNATVSISANSEVTFKRRLGINWQERI
jgi:hypothetical protein